jgi:hypothetical protein
VKNSAVTLTVQEAAQMFRDAGVSISLDALKQGIIQKEFPIGHAIKLTQWVFIIYKKPLIEYLRSMGATITEE